MVLGKIMKTICVSLLLAVLVVVGGCSTSSKPITVMLSFASPESIDYGQTLTFTATVTNDSKNGGVTWAITGAGTLSGQTTTSATYNPPAPGAATSAMITATSVSDPTKNFTITINVTPVPTITNASSTFAAAVQGTAYSATVTETGGAGTLTYSVTVGNLPAGLSLNGSTGAITGTATGPSGPVTFTVQIRDSSAAAPQTNTKSFTITVNQPPPPVITPAVLAAGVEGAVYSQTIAETGGLGPFTFSKSAGAFPAGLNISNAGVISGTPTGPNGASAFTIKIVDSSNPPQSATQAFSILVNLPAAPKINTTTLPADVEGTAYSQTIAATGFGTLVYSVPPGTLPAGLNLNTSTGAITGTPTGPNKTSSFTVTVTDGSNPVQTVIQALSITINLPAAPKISTTTLPGATEFVPYSQAVAATGFGTLVYSVPPGTLPAGLSLNTSTGAITGSATGPNGTISFTVTVTDGSNPAQTVSQALSIAVGLPAAPSITTTSLPNATVGGTYNQSVTFTGGHGPFTWNISVGALPAGFAINPGTGVITSASVPNAPGTSSFTVQVVDSSNPAQSATKALSISIVTGPLAVTAATLPTGAVGDVYQLTNLGASGGVPPYTWSITTGALPTGLNPLSSGGQISGTPTASGTFNFTAKVTDSSSTTATGNFSITVNAALAVTTSSLPPGTQGTTYTSTNLNATGGVTPYTWTINSGALPTGIMLTGNTISGLPTVSGTFPITFKVTDAAGGTALSSGLNIVLAAEPPLMVTTTNSNLPAGTINAAYSTSNLNASGGIQPYTWSITSGSLPTGMNPLSSSGQISGTPTATGTFNFTVKVTDSTTPTANTNTASLSITVNAVSTCGSGSESLLTGQYAFVLKGFDSGTGAGETQPEPALVGGVLTFSGSGTISSGTLDQNLYNTAGVLSLAVSSGTYQVGSDHRACLSITTSQGTQHYRASLANISGGVASLAHLIDFDSAGPFTSGEMKKQTTAAFGTGSSQVSGNYVFGVSSIDNTTQCNTAGAYCKFGAVGVFNLSAGSVTGGEVDFNEGGQLDNNSANTNFPASPISINSGGVYTVSSTTGRGTLVFKPSVAPNNVTTVMYVVSASEVLILGSDDQTQNSLFAGELLQQSTSSFSANPLSGAYVGYQSGLSTNVVGAGRVTLILLTASGTGISGTQIRNDGGSFQDKAITGLTYSVTSSGRMTVAGGGTGSPIFYLMSASEAFFLGGDNHTETGVFQSQTGGPFIGTTLSGSYAFGNIDPVDSSKNDSSGIAAFASPNLDVTEDDNGSGSQTVGGTQSFTYSVDSTGLISIPSSGSSCTISASSTTCQTLLYIISPTKVVILDTGSSSPTAPIGDK